MIADLGLRGSLRPRLISPREPKVRTVHIPGMGRVAFTRDEGNGGLFNSIMLSTKLRALVRDPAGRLVEERDLGSGIVTNAGVLALAQDAFCPGVATNPANLFANLKWQAWGTGVTAAATTDIKLQAQALANGSSTEAQEATNTLLTNGEGKPKLISTRILKAESSLAITEWGIFTGKVLSATTGTPLTAVSATSGTVTGTPLTASSATALGETLKIINTASSADSWGLITKNTTSVVTVPAWYLTSSGAVKEPTATSAYVLRPVMFDHVVFAAVNVENGNTVEFPFELEVKSGG